MSGRRRLGLMAAAGLVVVAGFVVARRAGVIPSKSAGPERVPAAAPVSSGALPMLPGPARARLRLPPPASTAPSAAPSALTPVGAARALEAIGRNEQTRRLFIRLQPLGLSPEQQNRVLLVLGAEALRPAPESPTLEALRANGTSRVLSEEEAERVRNERHQITERTLRRLRPALAAVLTPAQLDEANLGGDGPTP